MKHVCGILLVLLLALSVLVWQQSHNRSEESDSIGISQSGQVLHTFTMEEIKAFPPVQLEKSIASGKGENEEGLYTGVPLRVLLDSVDENLIKGSKQIISKASDGFESVYTPEEVLEEKNILVVYAKDGEPLGNASNGGTGPFRILVVNDSSGNRSTKYLNEIEVKN